MSGLGDSAAEAAAAAAEAIHAAAKAGGRPYSEAELEVLGELRQAMRLPGRTPPAGGRDSPPDSPALCGALFYLNDPAKRARFEAGAFGPPPGEGLPALRRRRVFGRAPGAAWAGARLVARADGSAGLFVGDALYLTFPPAEAEGFAGLLGAGGPFAASALLELDLWDCLGVSRLSLRLPLQLGYLVLSDCVVLGSGAFEACSLLASALGLACRREAETLCWVRRPLLEDDHLLVLQEVHPGLPPIYEVLSVGPELRLQEAQDLLGLSGADRIPSAEFLYALLGAAAPPGFPVRRTFAEPGPTPQVAHPLWAEFHLALAAQVSLRRLLGP